MGPARFGAADPKHGVQIVQPQPADLSGPKPIPDEQHQDRPIALVDWAVAPNRRQQAHDILALQSLRHGLVGHEPGRHDACGEAHSAPAARLGEQEERPQTLRIIVSRPAAPGASPVLRRYGIVDVGHAYGAQPHALGGQMSEEVVGSRAIALHGRIGETTLLAEPSCERLDLGVMRVAAAPAIVEPAQEAEPSDTVADEAVARLARSSSIAPASPRLRPQRRSNLDLRPAHPVAVLEVQKADQAQLIVGALSQGRSSRAGRLEMNEVSLPLPHERRRAILLGGAGEEDVVEHAGLHVVGGLSFPMEQGGGSYVDRTRGLSSGASGAHSPALTTSAPTPPSAPRRRAGAGPR